ncbi:MAG: nuclear transport factor 2 family protein [Chloroflexi bacterium]|nr:nuclear transport factor 2 family protein [Chloroflexota bacterium]
MQQELQQDQSTAATTEIIEGFNEVFNRHDVDGIMVAMTEDCLFESAGPVPEGGRYQGQQAVQAVWERFFASSPRAVFEAEDLFAAWDRGMYGWADDGSGSGHVRRMDISKVRDGKVTENLWQLKV